MQILTPRPAVSFTAEEQRRRLLLLRGAPAYPAWKRCVDVAVALVALPVLGFVLAAAAVLMRFVSPGPVLFRQVRIGQLGRQFTVLKIRTMAQSASEDSHAAHLNQLIAAKQPLEKLDTRGDQRLIRGGLFLRAAGLDELPQIINILRGEMSLVGPRPCLPFEFAQYPTESIERFRARPGLTGLWQVSGKNRTTFEEMARLDNAYVRHASAKLDFRILLKTFPTLLRQVLEARARVKARAAFRQSRAVPAAVSIAKHV